MRQHSIGIGNILRYELSNGQKERLARRLKGIPAPALNLPMRAALIRAAGALDDEVLDAVLAMAGDPATPPFLIIDNCPVGDLPDTPRTCLDPVVKDTTSENFLVMLGLLLGQPCAYQPESFDRVVLNLVPNEGRGGERSNYGYKVPLDYHVDLTHLGAHAPDFNVLLCLRGDPLGETITYCLDARDVVARLSVKAKAVLREPLYRIQLPDSFRVNTAAGDGGVAESALYSEPMPLLSGPDHLPQLGAEFNSTHAMTVEAEEALRELEGVCSQPGLASEIRLSAGMTLIIRNRAALHARSAYRPQWTGQQRWLQRLYVISDLWKSRVALAPHSCVLEGTFIRQG